MTDTNEGTPRKKRTTNPAASVPTGGPLEAVGDPRPGGPDDPVDGGVDSSPLDTVPSGEKSEAAEERKQRRG